MPSVFDKYQPIGTAPQTQSGSVFSKYQPVGQAPQQAPMFQPQPTPPPQGFPDILGAGLSQAGQSIGGFATGVAKGVGSTVMGAGELGARGLQAVTEPLQNVLRPSVQRFTEPVVSQLGQAPTPEQTYQSMEKLRSDITTPKGLAESLGFGAEQIGEFFLPVGAVGKAAKAGQAVKFGTRAAKVGKEALQAAAVTALQKGKADSDAIWAAGLTAGFGGAGQLLQKAGQKIGGRIVGDLAGLARGEKGKAGGQIALDKLGQQLIDKLPVTSNRQKIAGVVNRFKKDVYSNITKNVAEAQTAGGKPQSFKQILKNVVDEASSMEGLRMQKVNPVDYSKAQDIIKDLATRYDKLYGKEKTLTGLQNIKASISGKAVEGATKGAVEKSFESQLKSSLGRSVEQVAKKEGKSVEELNKLYNAARVVGKKLKATGESSGLLGSIISGTGFGGATLAATGNPLEAIKAGVGGIVAQKLLRSPAAKILAAKGLSRVPTSGKPIPALSSLLRTFNQRQSSPSGQ